MTNKKKQDGKAELTPVQKNWLAKFAQNHPPQEVRTVTELVKRNADLNQQLRDLRERLNQYAKEKKR